MPKHDKLTAKQELFIAEYVKSKNGKRAAIAAGYSENSAEVEASRLLSNAKVSEKLKVLLEEQRKRVLVEADDILRESNRLGYSDIRGLYDNLGAIRPPREWPTKLARAVASIEVREEFMDLYERRVCENCNRKMDRELTGYTKKVKLWPKDRALDSLGRHKKLFTDVVEINDTSFAKRLAEARKRKK